MKSMDSMNIVFDGKYRTKFPTTQHIMFYICRYISIDSDRWGSLYSVKDVYRVLIKLEVV